MFPRLLCLVARPTLKLMILPGDRKLNTIQMLGSWLGMVTRFQIRTPIPTVTRK